MRKLAPFALTALTSAFLCACSGDSEKPNGPIIIVVNDGAAATTDAGDGGSTSKKALGEECAGPDQCESNVCFLGTKASYCTLTCTAANGAQVCVPPIFDGMCNNQGFCRRPN